MTEKDTVRVEIVKMLLDGGETLRALDIIRVMREEGVKRDDLDLHQGVALRMQGMNTEAEQLLLQAKANMARNPAVHAALCVLYADTERLEAALSACQRAVDLDADEASHWNNLGFLQLASGDPSHGLVALRRAVEIDPMSVRYRNNLGSAQAATGDERGALSTFLTTYVPADAHYNLGAALERVGNENAALEYYERALKYNADHLHAASAAKRLREHTNPPSPQGAQPSEEL